MSTTTIPADTVRALGRTAQRTRALVPMRDGTLLATDIYWAADAALETLPGRPVLLERSPYDVRATRASDGVHHDGSPVSPESSAIYFVDRGYIVIRQDCRGRGGSQGTFSKYIGEADDGFDAHAWISAQPWCDGRIITQGVSYSAHTQTAAASVGASSIAAMILDSGGFANAYEAGGRFGGAFELKQVLWALRRTIRSRTPNESPELVQSLEARNLQAWFDAMPWRKGFSPLSRTPEYEDFVFEQWSHENLDEFWTQPGLYAHGYYQNFPIVPVMNICSWYDPYVFTAVENFQALREKDPRTCLVMGPWTHGARSVSYAGDVDFGDAATLDGNLSTDYLEFKSTWLRAVLEHEAPPWPPVTYFLMGGGSGRRNDAGRMQHGGRWCYARQWPPQGAEPLTLFLNLDQSLTAHPPVEPGSISFDFDPKNPVPSLGGGITSGEPLMQGGAFDQTPDDAWPSNQKGLPLSSRQDVVAFQTTPLERPLTVVGQVTLELEFSTTAPDTDVTAKLIDVYPPNADYPDGFAMNITDGLLRCRYRGGFRTPQLMEANKVYSISVRLPDTANRFAAGHRIRLDVSSSNFPRCDVNPNTGRPVMGDRTSQVARNTLHLGASHLRLTVLLSPDTGNEVDAPGRSSGVAGP